MKALLLVFLLSFSLCLQAQTGNEQPVRTAYKLSLPVSKGSVYEMDVAATPYVQKQSIVQVYPGETIYLEAEEKGGKLLLTSVKSIKDPAKTITVVCKQTVKNNKHENVMLQVTNPFNRNLIYTARMFPLAANKWVDTDVLPVDAGLSGFEVWPDVVISFGLSDWQLASK